RLELGNDVRLRRVSADKPHFTAPLVDLAVGLVVDPRRPGPQHRWLSAARALDRDHALVAKGAGVADDALRMVTAGVDRGERYTDLRAERMLPLLPAILGQPLPRLGKVRISREFKAINRPLLAAAAVTKQLQREAVALSVHAERQIERRFWYLPDAERRSVGIILEPGSRNADGLLPPRFTKGGVDPDAELLRLLARFDEVDRDLLECSPGRIELVHMEAGDAAEFRRRAPLADRHHRIARGLVEQNPTPGASVARVRRVVGRPADLRPDQRLLVRAVGTAHEEAAPIAPVVLGVDADILIGR